MLCNINVQHDCATASCTQSQTKYERQERQETNKTKTIIEHAPTNIFILNMHALHNYKRIAAVVPSKLLAEHGAAHITDHTAIRLHTAKILQQNKAVDEGNPSSTTQANSGETSEATPAFERPANKRKKGKEKVSAAPRKGKGHDTAAARSAPPVATQVYQPPVAHHPAVVSQPFEEPPLDYQVYRQSSAPPSHSVFAVPAYFHQAPGSPQAGPSTRSSGSIPAHFLNTFHI